MLYYVIRNIYTYIAYENIKSRHREWQLMDDLSSGDFDDLCVATVSPTTSFLGQRTEGSALSLSARVDVESEKGIWSASLFFFFLFFTPLAFKCL